MSLPQSKLIDSSALPRLVVERISRTAGTERTACSTGRVIGDHHLLRRAVAGVHLHHDARKIHVREKRHRQLQRRGTAAQRQQRQQQ